MPPSGIHFSNEPQRALLTPSASPSLPPSDRPPTKRARLRSTPSSISATPSTSNESTSSADVNSARRASTLRVLNVWAQLAERYNKRLDEDDIVDLYSGAIIKDRGVVKGTSKEYHIGHFAQLDGDLDGDQDQEESEQEDDDNELNALPPSETTTDDDAPISKKELLRGVPPLSATTDAEDLREFLEAEKRRRELAGDEEEEEEEDLSPGQLTVIRKALEEESQKEAAAANQSRDGASTKEGQVDITPTRPSTRVPLPDDESEDELGQWTHDESTAIYPIARDESEQDVRQVEQDIIELTETDSDAEFEALLARPPRFTREISLPPKEAQPRLQPPADSERGRSKSRTRSKISAKAEATPRPERRPRSPLSLRKSEESFSHRRQPSVLKETATRASDDGESDQKGVSHVHKGKGKEITSSMDNNHRDKTPKSLGVVSRSRKRKRIVSSTSSDPLVQSPAEPKSSPQRRGKRTSQTPIARPQSDGPKLMLDQEISTPVRFESNNPGCSRSLSSSVSKNQQPLSYVSPESIQSTSHDYNSHRALPANPPIAAIHPYPPRYPYYTPSMLSSPNQGTPGPSLIGHLPHPLPPPPPMDPAQAQQAHYLLAQAMQHLSYLISATMTPYTGYAPSSGQSWQHLPPPHVYDTPTHHPPPFHGTRPCHTPSSSILRSGLTPSSPVRSSVSPPVEERRARSRGRSKSRGRRVSFKLDDEGVASNRESNTQPEHHSGPKGRKQIPEVKRERGKEKTTEELDDTESPLREVGRGRTPGPPGRQKMDASRGRSLSRRGELSM